MPKLTEAKTVKQRTRGIRTEFTDKPTFENSALPARFSLTCGFNQMQDY
jgi:hypothetical protein